MWLSVPRYFTEFTLSERTQAAGSEASAFCAATLAAIATTSAMRALRGQKEWSVPNGVRRTPILSCGMDNSATDLIAAKASNGLRVFKNNIVLLLRVSVLLRAYTSPDLRVTDSGKDAVG